MIQPVVMRELLVRSRQSSTRHVRLVATLLAGLITAVFLLVARLSGAAAGGPPLGGQLFSLLSELLLFFVLFEGVRSSAGGICEERREGTLGLLFLSRLSGADVLLGKLAGAALNAGYAVVAALPVLGLAMTLGGVTGAEFARISLALLAALTLALSCGMCASAFSKDSLTALAWAFLLLMAILTIPILVDALWLPGGLRGYQAAEARFGVLSPAVGLQLATAAVFPQASGAYGASLLSQIVLAVLLVAGSSRGLEGHWRSESSVVRAGFAPAGSPRRAGSAAAALLRGVHQRKWLWGMIALTMLAQVNQVISLLSGGRWPMLIGVLFVPAGLSSLCRTLLLIHISASAFTDARRTGEMEILLTTPIDNRDLVTALWGMLRRLVLWLLVTQALVALAGFLVAWWIAPRGGAGAGTPPFWFFPTQTLASLLSGALQLCALVWVSLWNGAWCAKTSTAVLRTFGFVVIATGLAVNVVSVAFVLPVSLATGSWAVGSAVGMAAMILGPQLLSAAASAAWIRWARRRLFGSFRQAVSGLG